MPTRIAINGFGRTGRMFLRAALHHPDLELVAVNDLSDASTLAHLLKHDSIHGALKYEVKVEGDSIFVAGRAIQVLSEHDPAKLPWQRLGVRIAIESSGKFRKREKAALHLAAGASKVLISAPGDGADVTVCLGVNQEAYDPRRHHIISNASCTTNCLAPIAKVLHQNFGIAHGFMTTVHAYTNDQMLQDGPHKDLRRARAAALSMVPTSTGAAKAKGLVTTAGSRPPGGKVAAIVLAATMATRSPAAAISAKYPLAPKWQPFLTVIMPIPVASALAIAASMAR